MKRIEVGLDDELAEELERTAVRLGSTRSEVVRQAVRDRLSRLRIEEQERRHREGYERHPVRPGEFELGEDELFGSDGS